MIVRAFQKCSISNVLDKSNDDALQEEMSKGQHCCEWQSVNIASAHDAHLHDKNMCLSVNQEAVFFFSCKFYGLASFEPGLDSTKQAC